MISPSPRGRFGGGLLCLSMLLILTVCDRRSLTAPEAGSGDLVVRIVSGDAQSAPIGLELPRPIIIQAQDRKGKPIKDQHVNFRVVAGGGSVFAGASNTNKDGIAQEYWTLGPDLGLNRLEVRAVDPTTGEKLVFATITATGIPIPVATVTVTPATVVVEQGMNVQLTATLRDAAGNEMTGRAVEWSSSNSAVAMVGVSGQVYGNSTGGPVTITATSEGKTGTAQVTVIRPRVAYLALEPYQAELVVGSTVQMTATTYDVNGNVLLGREITWYSDDESIASVSNTGLVTGRGNGNVPIWASSEGNPNYVVMLVSTRATSITLTPSSQILITGYSGSIEAHVTDAAGYVITNRTVQWTSSNPGVVQVNGFSVYGGVSGIVAGGPVTITATLDDAVATATVTVRDMAPDPYEPNDFSYSARALADASTDGLEVTVAPWLHTQADEDWFEIRAKEGSGGVCFPGSQQNFKLTVRLTSVPLTNDYDLEVRDVYGNETRKSENGGSSDEQLIYYLAGNCGWDDQWIFLIRVYRYSGPATETPYRLGVKFERN